MKLLSLDARRVSSRGLRRAICDFCESDPRADTELTPLRAMRSYLEQLAQHTNVYRGLATSLGTVLQIGTPGCIAVGEKGHRLLENAQSAGVIRPDVRFDDIVCMAIAISLATEREASPNGHMAHLVDLSINGIVSGIVSR
ncbi:hypothetical protein HH303_18375 [Rhodospirillaceae bacterium KN72]|uniref:Transcriptional regulator SbtR-like C-terminal domain-containing protein n=1 Tax=Pacificispira spongiicola TaxID=2729598 RepID=A0A7Y0HH90_9PROT|nr:hypothetical protein [Pacificispira spongiicola]NMM46463.1 hypothetical protein [Pacificispira spongiicola]